MNGHWPSQIGAISPGNNVTKSPLQNHLCSQREKLDMTVVSILDSGCIISNKGLEILPKGHSSCFRPLVFNQEFSLLLM